MKGSLFFLKRFFKNPTVVASVIPTSKKGVETICRGIRGGVKQTVVEYGPGTGVITEHLLKPGVLSADSKVIAIEFDEPLAAHLKEHLHDPRLHVFHDSAEHVRHILGECGEDHADIVISGIPFSKISKDACINIMEETSSVLTENGTFVIYQVTDAVSGYLEGRFKILERGRIMQNIPPLLIYRVSKNGKA